MTLRCTVEFLTLSPACQAMDTQSVAVRPVPPLRPIGVTGAPPVSIAYADVILALVVFRCSYVEQWAWSHQLCPQSSK